eukprot:gene1394-1539_t
MQPVTVPISSTVISPGVQVVSVPPTVRSVDERPTRLLGIFQIIIGALCLIFGIALVSAVGSKHWVSTVGFGIWTGIWIAIGGILGVLSAVHKNTQGLNAANMAFAIVSSCITFFEVIFYAIAVSYYRTSSYCGYTYRYYYGYTYTCYRDANHTGVGLSAVLLFLVIAEFIVSIAVSIYCCKSACDCCVQSYGGAVVHQAPGGLTFATQQGIPISTQYGQPQIVSTYPSPQYIQAVPQTTMITTTVPTSQQYTQQPPPYAQ